MIDIKRHILLSIEEDIQGEDHSGAACIPLNAKSKAKLLVKDVGIISGVDVAKQVFSLIDPELKFNQKMNDGDRIIKGDIAFTVEGSSRSILKAERLKKCRQLTLEGLVSNLYNEVDLKL